MWYNIRGWVAPRYAEGSGVPCRIIQQANPDVLELKRLGLKTAQKKYQKHW